MSIWLVVWLAWKCPLGLGWLPDAAKPLICRPDVRAEMFMDRKDAEAKVRKLGCHADAKMGEVSPSGELDDKRIACAELITIEP